MVKIHYGYDGSQNGDIATRVVRVIYNVAKLLRENEYHSCRAKRIDESFFKRDTEKPLGAYLIPKRHSLGKFGHEKPRKGA